MHAALGGCARIAPRHRIMPRRPAAPLQRGPQNRIADIRPHIQNRTKGLRLFGRQPFIVDPAQPIGMDMPFGRLHIMQRMGQHHHTARRIHHIVIELLRKPLPELHRMFVKFLAFFPEIIGADDGGVAPRIAPAQPAFFQHSHIADAVLGCQIISGRQAMPASPDNHHVIGRARFGRGPLFGPDRTGQRIFQKGIGGKFHRRPHLLQPITCDPCLGPRMVMILAHPHTGNKGAAPRPKTTEPLPKEANALFIGYICTINHLFATAKGRRFRSFFAHPPIMP